MILESETWYSKTLEVTNWPEKGYYFFRDKLTMEIVYVGVAGIGMTKTLHDRVKQYYTPRDKGTRYFKLKAQNIELTEAEWETYKASRQPDGWRNYLESNYEFCILEARIDYDEATQLREVKKMLLTDEALLIGCFNPKFNY